MADGWGCLRQRKTKVKCLEKQKKPHQTIWNYYHHHIPLSGHTHTHTHTHTQSEQTGPRSQFKAHLDTDFHLKPQRPWNVMSLLTASWKGGKGSSDYIPWPIRKHPECFLHGLISHVLASLMPPRSLLPHVSTIARLSKGSLLTLTPPPHSHCQTLHSGFHTVQSICIPEGPFSCKSTQPPLAPLHSFSHQYN